MINESPRFPIACGGPQATSVCIERMTTDERQYRFNFRSWFTGLWTGGISTSVVKNEKVVMVPVAKA